MNKEISTISVDKMVQKKLSNYCDAKKIKIVKYVNSILESYFTKPKEININYNTKKSLSSILIYKSIKEQLNQVATQMNKSAKTLLEEIIMYNIK